MNIILYRNFYKKKNSTLQPSGGTSANVAMKEDCSIENPVFLINGVDLDVNYIQWNNSYYYVDDIILRNNNIYELQCSIDVLATWRTAIGNYTAFVERSSYRYDAMVNDPFLSPRQTLIGESVSSHSLGAYFNQSGCFIVQVMSEDGITLYACESLTPWGIILNPASYSSASIAAWIDSKISQAFDLDVYVGAIKWVPFAASYLDGGDGVQSTLKLGPISATIPTTVGNRVYKVSQSFTVRTSFTLNFPTHGAYTDFRNNSAKFTEYKAYFPGVGTVNLDPAIIGTCILSGIAIRCDMNVDLVSGAINYNLTDGANNYIIGEFNGNIAVDVPIGKANYNPGQALTSGLSGIASVAANAAAENYAGAVVGAVNSVVSVADNILSPQTSILTGGSGNKARLFSAAGEGIKISMRSYDSCDFPTGVLGRPLYRNVQISTIPGFIKCGAASISIAGAGPEKDLINSYLNGGFYYE